MVKRRDSGGFRWASCKPKHNLQAGSDVADQAPSTPSTLYKNQEMVQLCHFSRVGALFISLLGVGGKQGNQQEHP